MVSKSRPRTLEEMRAAARKRDQELKTDTVDVNREIASALIHVKPPTGVSVSLPVANICRSPYQPRVVFPQDELETLARDIQLNGLRQPIEVRRIPGNSYERYGATRVVEGQLYELIDGERRLQCVESVLGWSEIHAFIIEADDQEAAVRVTLANLFRVDLCDYERARAAKTLLDTNTASSQADVATMMGVSKMTITRLMEFFALPAEAHPILQMNPRCLSATFVSELAKFTDEGYGDLVVDSIRRAAEGKHKNKAIIAYIQKQLRPNSIGDTTINLVANSNHPIGKLSLSGRKISLMLDKSVSVDKFYSAMKKTLEEFDMAHLEVEESDGHSE
ncbi:ParB/RepB/Spo0J family partition protein [Parachitinimonas caeni]|uniref:ParB/RepB/Spo0J family partition protein n=1 Tax=Parachitinimonas caeni TaxID=3031301 RepID=A0ABT7DZI3_9NEIS|nr:ParB/RepB/Spo0J family partition protein [Parachitinimonas caeni]MDK2125481.1 ParB/RepB/Spo0J family partition protein [Parachitinimonas caeni]